MCRTVEFWKKRDGTLIAIANMTSDELEGRMKFLTERGKRGGRVYRALERQFNKNEADKPDVDVVGAPTLPVVDTSIYKTRESQAKSLNISKSTLIRWIKAGNKVKFI